MICRIALLSLYLILLFILANLVELFSNFGDGYFTCHILDPVKLSVHKLKLLLNSRGISYETVREKTDLVSLAEMSGIVRSNDIQVRNTHVAEEKFAIESNIIKEVDGSDNEAWIIRVHDEWSEMPLHEADWKELQQRVSLFGIRVSSINCSADPQMCNRKEWTGSKIVLALPNKTHGLRFYEYRGQNKLSAVLHWINKLFGSSVKKMHDSDDLHDGTVWVLAFTALNIPPLFFTSVASKFRNRANFRSVDVRSVKGKQLQAKFAKDCRMVPGKAAYVIVMSKQIHSYGDAPYGWLSSAALGSILRWLEPESNDCFLVIFQFMNMLCLLNLVVKFGSCTQRAVCLISSLAKSNILLIIFWLPLLTLLQSPWSLFIHSSFLHLLRLFSTSDLGYMIRLSWLQTSWTFLIITYSMFILTAAYFSQSFLEHSRFPEASSMRLTWRTMWRPEENLEVEEENVSRLIERLAIPDFWLRPIVNPDYIKGLPLWWFSAQHCRDELPNEESCIVDDAPTLPFSDQSEDEATTEEFCNAFGLEQEGGSKCTCGRNLEKKRWFLWPSYECDLSLCKPPQNAIRQHECSICLLDYRPSSVLCGLPCGHAYHQVCIFQWLSRDNHDCPICRWPTYKSKSKLP